MIRLLLLVVVVGAIGVGAYYFLGQKRGRRVAISKSGPEEAKPEVQTTPATGTGEDQEA